MAKRELTFGIVLSGGGARGAYEAGVVHYLRTALPAPVRNRTFQLYCGSSVGGLNSCFLASHAENPQAQGTLIRKAWENVRQENIYRRDLAAIARLLTRSVTGMTVNLLRRTPGEGEAAGGIHFQGLVDTSPFPKFLQRMVAWRKLHENIERKIVHGVSLTLTNMHSSRLEFFIHKHESVPYSGDYVVRFGPVDWRHVMAGAAIPILFPPVEIGGVYYADGGLRLNTPMSPAIHMGADRVLVVGMHDPHMSAANGSSAQPTATATPPTLGEIFGTILSSIFLDRLEYDIKQMTRINRVIEWAEEVYGKDFLTRINTWLRKEGIEGDVASRGLKRLKVFAISPSRDVRQIFGEVLASPSGLRGFSAFEKMLLKLLDVDMHRGQEFLSYFLFLPDYLKALCQLGYDDAHTRHDDLVEFLSEE